MRYKIIFLIFIIFFNLNLFSQEKLKTKVLFVFYDAGETIALLPVLSELDKFQVDYKVLLMATARNFRKGINPKKIIDISSCEISEKIESISWPRERKLTVESLNGPSPQSRLL